MPRQQRHLAGDDAEFWPTASARLRRGFGDRLRSGGGRRQTRHDLPLGAAKVEIDRPAAGIVEDDDRFFRIASRRLHHGDSNFGQGAGGQPLLADEGGKVPGGDWNHWKYPFWCPTLYPDKLNRQYCPGDNLPSKPRASPEVQSPSPPGAATRVRHQAPTFQEIP